MKIGIFLAAATLLAGCTTDGLQTAAAPRLGYPAEGRDPLSVASIRRDRSSPTVEPAFADGRTSEPASEARNETIPYDMSRDPHVTAVLLPPVETDRSAGINAGPNGKRLMLPAPAKLEIVDLVDMNAVYAGANP